MGGMDLVLDPMEGGLMFCPNDPEQAKTFFAMLGNCHSIRLQVIAKDGAEFNFETQREEALVPLAQAVAEAFGDEEADAEA